MIFKLYRIIINNFYNLINIYYVLQDLKKSRCSSYPYISGDSFRNLCDIVIEKDKDLISLLDNIYIHKNKKIIIFVSLNYIESIVKSDYFILSLKKFKEIGNCEISLILHNGDKVPSVYFYNSILQFTKVYSVNASFMEDRINHLPLGLENYYHFKNGLIYDFLEYKFNNLILLRDIQIYANFSLDTNIGERKSLMNILISRNIEYYDGSLSLKQYRNLLKRSKFVLSPPGNGLDCHRTWESILLGAVPVVKKDSLNSDLISDMPIVVVDKWEDFLDLDKYTLDLLYYNKKKMPITKCYIDYWIKMIKYTE